MRFISLDNSGLQHVVKHTSMYMQAMNRTSNTKGRQINLYIIVFYFGSDRI